MVNVQECWMNFHCNNFKNDSYLRRGRYLFGNNNDCSKTLCDSKRKHYHIYMYTENKVKIHKATISNIFVYYKYYLLLRCW